MAINFSNGLFGPPTGLVQQQSAPQQKPAFFGEGGAGRNIAGAIGDALLQLNGARPIFAPAQQQRQMMQYQQQQQDRKRQQDWEDYQRQWDYQVGHPKPSTAQPYRFEANNGDVYELDATGKPQKVFADPTPKMNFIPDGMGGGQWVAVPTMAPSAPMKPIGKLTPIDGGPSQPATGGFR
jgi:hypothetical protein